MNIKRIWILIKTEALHGSKDVVLIMAVAFPILLALFVNLAFGNIFTDRPTLGIFDAGNSRISSVAAQTESVALKTYSDETALKEATASGAVDMGIALPGNFDEVLASGTITLKVYVWGESSAKSREVIPVVLADSIRQIKGAELPVNIITVPLGEGTSQPWSDRLLPMVVLMALFFGGLMIPASSLINEKNRHTLEALNVSPASLREIFTAKGVIGAALALVMGILTLLMSSGFNSSFPLLVLILGLGAVLAAELGLIAGAYINDMNTLFALWKFGGILLLGPVFIYMFPQIPQWIGYVFPTFYVVKPVVDVSINGAGFSDITLYLAVLCGIVIGTGAVLIKVLNRMGAQALRLNG